jgi:hypothetical protein
MATNGVAKRPRGRQTLYTPEIADEICRRLVEGQSLAKISKFDEQGNERLNGEAQAFPKPSTIRLWAVDDIGGFAARYARARDCYYDAEAEECIEIADNTTPATAHADRLRIDTRKWFLSKLAAKRYGDKIAVTGGNADDPPLQVDSVGLARRVAFILAQGAIPGSTLDVPAIEAPDDEQG